MGTQFRAFATLGLASQLAEYCFLAIIVVMRARTQIALPTVFALLAIAGPRAAAQSQYLLQKQELYQQTSADGATPSVMIAPYSFNGHMPSAATVTPPGFSAITLSTMSGPARISDPFLNKPALDAAFPNGNYSVSGTSFGTLGFSFQSDDYPVPVPQVVGGTWQNNVLLVDPTRSATITFNNFTGYGMTGAGSEESFQLTSESSADDVNLMMTCTSASVPGLPLSPTPFTSFVIPAGTLHPGLAYQATLAYGNFASLNSTQVSDGVIASLDSDLLVFYVAASSSSAIAAPMITSQLSSQTVAAGSSATLTLGVSSQTPANTSYAWYFNSQPIDFRNSRYSYNGPSLTIDNVTPSDAGSYAVTAINGGGRADSQTATLSVATSPPAITEQPQNATVMPGGSASFNVTSTGVGPFSYQWYFNGVAISNATSASYAISGASAANAGVYTVGVTNSDGSVVSSAATLTINAVIAAAAFTLQPVSQTVATGSTAVFTIAASGNPTPTYQWVFNGSEINGTTGSRCLIAAAASPNAGTYTCVATNSAGSATSNGATLAVALTSNPGRLINLSVLTEVRGTLSVGFVVGGSGTNGTENLLIRATGPALTAYNVNNPLPDPTLTVFQQSTRAIVAANAGWGVPSGNPATVTAADHATGAFALTNPASLDSALVTTLPISSGGYSVQVSGKSGDSGEALTEVYDDTASYTSSDPRLINLSCLAPIAGGQGMVAGFVIGGSTAKTVLIRASGPTLASSFGIGGTMPDPSISVQAPGSSAVLASNAGWGGDPQLSAVAASVGAFQFSGSSSLDSAVLLTLAPGAYFAQVTSVSGAAGTALLEIYEVP